MATKGSGAGRWVMGVIGVTVVGGLVLLFIPIVFGNHRYPDYLEAGVKQNLHSIQLALERYSVDHVEPYPSWISGGSVAVDSSQPPDERYLTDPLLREGYINKYPANPFTKHGKHKDKTLQEIRQRQEILMDPLRPAKSAPFSAPTFRFGEDYTLMGNVLADPRYAEQIVARDENGNTLAKRTGADVIYRCWDIEELEEPQYWLQGQFMYKSFGASIMLRKHGEDQLMPSHFLERYVLAGYGSVHTKGMDLLGEVQAEALRTGGDSWLEYRNHSGLDFPGYPTAQASPFSIREATTESFIVDFVNPNGVADGICIVLNAGDSWDHPLFDSSASFNEATDLIPEGSDSDE